MYLYIKHDGQLGNRLMPILPAYSFCIEHNTTLYVLFAEKKYLKLFPNIRHAQNIKFLFNAPLWKKLQKQLIRYSESHGLEIHDKLEDVDVTKDARKLQFIDGWQHRSDLSYIQTHKAQMLRTFSFKQSVEDTVNKYFTDKGVTYIGVHIRRGDYKYFLSGKYYYSDDVYHRIMKDLAAQCSGEVRFLISSNEGIHFEDSSLDYFQIPDATAAMDMYALSRCDYIIGPPSTFSQWASFYGSVPLQFILDENQQHNLADFCPIARQDYYENGKWAFDY